MRVAAAPEMFDGAEARVEQWRRLPSPVGGGRYEFQRLIGEGKHKRVYLAFDHQVVREVALALIKAEAFDDLGEARVWREAEVMERLSGHANTVAFYGSGEDRYGRPYLVIEHMEGGDVSARVIEAVQRPIDLAQVLRIAAEVASALAYVHAHGIVHRDIKPENLWVSGSGVAKLGDFGLSLASGECQPGGPAVIEGTAAYIPPEQARGGPADERADLYSLGALLYELLCGRPPFVADNPAAVVAAHLHTRPDGPSRRRADVPRALDALVLSLLEKAPENRPQAATDVLGALAAVRPRSRTVALVRGLGRRGHPHVLRRVAA
jgi:eukaryotic-like serine/threonine-protein kinase